MALVAHHHHLWGVPAWPLALVVGVCLGSFANAAVWRLPRGVSVFQAKSKCTVCGTPLGFGEMVPVLGWFLLRGRCLHCRAPFSLVYPMAEALMAGLLVAITWWFQGPSQGLLPLWWGVLCLFVVARVDMATYLVFPGFLLWTWVVGVVLMVATGAHGPWGQHLLGALAAGGGFVILMTLAGALIGEEALGLGDAVLATWIGWFLGWNPLGWWVVLSFVLGGVLGIPWFLVRLLQGDPDARRLPFGPFLSAAAALIWTLGPDWIRELTFHLMAGGVH